MENYKPNSHKYKEEQKAKQQTEQKVKKVVTGQVSTKKKNGFRKIADTFIQEDMPRVKNYILDDVLIPSIKKAVSDIVRNGIDMLLYGETGRSKENKPRAARVSYRSYYESPDTSRRDRYESRSTAYDYDDIVLTDRGDAEVVLNQMDEIIEKYGFVKVADLYDLVGITTNNHCANNYGWTDIRSARVVRVQDGYILKLPKALPID